MKRSGFRFGKVQCRIQQQQNAIEVLNCLGNGLAPLVVFRIAER